MSKHVKDVQADFKKKQVYIDEDTIKFSDLVMVGEPYKLKGYTFKNSFFTVLAIVVIWCLFTYFVYGQAALVNSLFLVLGASLLYMVADWFFTHKKFPDVWVCSMHDVNMKYRFEWQLTEAQLAEIKSIVKLVNLDK